MLEALLVLARILRIAVAVAGIAEILDLLMFAKLEVNSESVSGGDTEDGGSG
jgi:hypothetical protein